MNKNETLRLATMLAMLGVDVPLTDKHKPKVWAWDERDTSLDYLPRPKSHKDRLKRIRKAAHSRKIKRGF